MREFLETLWGIAIAVAGFASDFVGLLNTYNGAVTAVATVFIGVFTLVLARVTGRQVRLARQEFISSHRPKIIVHSVELAYDADDEGRPTLGAEIQCFNVGDTTATITELVGNIQIREVPLRAGIILPAIELKKSIVVRAGESQHLRIASDFDDRTLNIASRHGGGRPILCIGVIGYRDDVGIWRQTGFCRQYATMTGEGRWHEYATPETKLYEYAY